jgi:hypothetical protein
VGRTTALFRIHRFRLRTRTPQPLIISLRSPLRANPFVSRDSLPPFHPPPFSLNSTLENDNLRNEYATLFSHVEKDIPWARIALQQEPEAINLWIGNSRSVTALHKDNYENVYVQIIGEKHFCLLPPVAYACVAERELRPASYVSLDFRPIFPPHVFRVLHALNLS